MMKKSSSSSSSPSPSLRQRVGGRCPSLLIYLTIFAISYSSLTIIHFTTTPPGTFSYQRLGAARLDSSSLKGTNKEEGEDSDEIIPKIFEPWAPYDRPIPCYKDKSNGQILNITYQDTAPAIRGLFFQKTPKAASTTSSGVALRIARNLAKRMDIGSQFCDARFSHGSNQDKWATRFQNRDKQHSFLFTMIREPSARFTSQYFYRCKTLASNSKLTCSNFQWFQSTQPPDFYISYLSTTRPKELDKENQKKATIKGILKKPTSLTKDIMVEEGNKIMKEYDFIGVTERFAESLVVLKNLLGLRMADILYYSSKTKGSFAVHQRSVPWHKGVCRMSTGPVTERGLAAYLKDQHWHDRIMSDNLLYQAVNQSLDLTIDRIGRDVVQRDLEKFQFAQKLVHQRCDGKVRMPCEKEGHHPIEKTDCVIRDWACGFSCLDVIATELNLW